MKLRHYMRKEQSGLATTTLELVKYEQKAGHDVEIRQPGEDASLYGRVESPDAEIIHSQLPQASYFNRLPRFMWMHGEPLSSVSNGISMKAILDLAPKVDAFLAMREAEVPIWSSIKRTYLVNKGIDLEVYHPLDGVTERLSGEPAVLYIENWRGSRNPLYLCVAMQEVWQKYPKARLHLYNCQDPRMQATFKAWIQGTHSEPFIRSLLGRVNPLDEVNLLYNRVDIVVSCLYPLYARGIEAFGAGKAFIGPGYREHEYPWTCDLEPSSIARAILRCWENYDQINYRTWAETYHDVARTVKDSTEIYARYL